MTKYTVEAERGRLRWSLQAVEAPGAISEVDRLADVDKYMREAIHIVTGDPAEEIEIELVPVLSDEVRGHLRRATELRRAAEDANAAAASERRAAARALHDTGISTRDLGTILGVSHQRAHQLIST